MNPDICTNQAMSFISQSLLEIGIVNPKEDTPESPMTNRGQSEIQDSEFIFFPLLIPLPTIASNASG